MSICAYSHNENFTTVYPPSNYPPAAPYAQLTAFFKELIREGILTSFLVKALLYPQVIQDIDTTKVILRKNHTNTVRLHRKVESWSSSCSSESCESCKAIVAAERAAAKLKRQNAVEKRDSDTYEVIEYITMGKSDSAATETQYESFIDHGIEADCTNQIFKEFFASTKVNSTIGSTAIPCFQIDTADEEEQQVLLTSTAKMHLGVIQQQSSNATQMSSFEHRLEDGHMACEDLLNVDDDMEIVKNSDVQRHNITERHR